MAPPTLISQPLTPRSLYRPLQYTYAVTYDTPVEVTAVRLANSSDVSSYPSLVEGVSIIVVHSTYSGFDPGQHMLLAGCGDWSGIRQVVEVLDSTHTAINGAAFTDFSGSGTIRVYLNNHKFLVYLWHDTSETKPRSILRITPNDSGSASFSINTALKTWIESKKLHEVVTADLTSSGHISTEFLSSVMYRIQVLDGFDVPDENGVNVWTLNGTWDPESGTPKCAVNGVHPYDHEYATDANAKLQWSKSNMDDYELGNEAVARFLTYGPRAGLRLMAPNETGRLVVLCDDSGGFAGGADYRIVLFGYDAAGIPTNLGSSDVFTPAAGVSSFAIPTGPAELTTLVEPDFPLSGYAYYAVQIASGTVGGAVTEVVKFKYDTSCSEARRRFHWLNKLGGIDDYAFTRREVASTKVKRSTLSKPYASGTGYDYTTRMYRVDPARGFTVTSERIKPQVRRWLVEDLLESANILTTHGGTRYSTVVPTTDGTDAHSTENVKTVLTLAFNTGVDNVSQEA